MWEKAGIENNIFLFSIYYEIKGLQILIRYFNDI